VTVANRQISKTRNDGARAATGDHLIFVDADTQVNDAVVRAALDAMRAGAVGGGAAVRFADGPRWVHMGVRLLIPLFRLARWAAGCFVFCTREAFDRSGGFSVEYFAGEEIHFSQALKRLGRFVVVRAYVLTSARKVEGRTFWQTLRLAARIMVRNPLGVKRRDEAAFWYDGKR
jgi:GT2 family glycosyltransferase